MESKTFTIVAAGTVGVLIVCMGTLASCGLQTGALQRSKPTIAATRTQNANGPRSSRRRQIGEKNRHASR